MMTPNGCTRDIFVRIALLSSEFDDAESLILESSRINRSFAFKYMLRQKHYSEADIF